MNTPFPLLARLRLDTAAAHRQLEAALDVESALRQTESYGMMLAGFYGFHQAAERAMEASAGLPLEGYDPVARRKSPWLREDLLALGWSGDRIEAQPVPDAGDLPCLPDAAALLGCAYVMEGSTLGGRHIEAMMSGNAAIPLEARRFFQGYGNLTGAKWTGFLKVLEDFGNTAGPDQFECAARTARGTFQSLGEWMQRRHADAS